MAGALSARQRAERYHDARYFRALAIANRLNPVFYVAEWWAERRAQAKALSLAREHPAYKAMGRRELLADARAAMLEDSTQAELAHLPPWLAKRARWRTFHEGMVDARARFRRPRGNPPGYWPPRAALRPRLARPRAPRTRRLASSASRRGPPSGDEDSEPPRPGDVEDELGRWLATIKAGAR